MPENILLYHITHINNLQSIIKKSSLWSHARIRQHTIIYKDVANQDVQSRREHTKIPVGAGGYLHDHVPFYFAPRSLCCMYCVCNKFLKMILFTL